MKALVKPKKNELLYEEESVMMLCENQECDCNGKSCQFSSDSSNDDEILF